MDKPYFGPGASMGAPSGLGTVLALDRQSAMSDWGEGIAKAVENYKGIQDAGKAADYFMKAGGDEAFQTMGIHPEVWKTLGSREKIAAVSGYMKQQGVEEAAAKIKEYQGIAEWRKAQADRAQQDTADEGPIGTAVNRFATMPPISLAIANYGSAPQDESPADEGDGATTEPPATREPSFQERMRYALATSGLAGRHVPKLIEALSKYGQMAGDADGAVTPPIEYPVMGGKYTAIGWRGNKNRSVVKNVDTSNYTPPPGTYLTPDGQVKALPKEAGPAKLPDAASALLATQASTIADNTAKLDMSDEELAKTEVGIDGKQARTKANRAILRAQQAAKTIIDTHRTLGYYGDEERNDLYQHYGLKTPTGKGSAKEVAAPKGRGYTDKSGRVYTYTGTANDPTTDKDPSHWH